MFLTGKMGGVLIAGGARFPLIEPKDKHRLCSNPLGAIELAVGEGGLLLFNGWASKRPLVGFTPRLTAEATWEILALTHHDQSFARLCKAQIRRCSV